MSNDPTCPGCGGASVWNMEGKDVLCPHCLHEAVTFRVPGALHDIGEWLVSKNAGLLGVFNLLAISIFVHASNYRNMKPEATVADSWAAFKAGHTSASEIFHFLEGGNWVDANTRTLVERLEQIHFSAFFGQWAISLKSTKVELSYEIKGVRLMLNGKAEEHKEIHDGDS